MQVIYNDPDGRAGTYHPKLGYLKSGEQFELDDDIATKYVESGLLKKITPLSPQNNSKPCRGLINQTPTVAPAVEPAVERGNIGKRRTKWAHR